MLPCPTIAARGSRAPAARWLAGALAACGLLLAACTTATSPLPDAEVRAQRLDQSLICPICPGETLERSQVQLAKQMQASVREQIAAGRSDEEIRAFFVARYGERVLAAPPREGFHWLVWAAPSAVIALALLALAWVTGAMRRRPDTAPDAGLAPYLAQVDRELGAPAAGADGPPPDTPGERGG